MQDSCCRRRLRISASLLVGLLCLPLAMANAAAEAASGAAATGTSGPTGEAFLGVERVVAFADVHGAWNELTGLLRSAGVVDAGLHWAAGRTHVVSLGDLLDRGAESRRVMDLLMRLQGEAQAAGGRLHVVLGNHEAMNLLGDLRDVAPGEYAAFVAEEPAEVRARAREAWLASQGPESGPQFDERFPPGWFGHRAALAPAGRYGRWLLSLPAAITIDDTLFMHGGPSRVLSGLALPEINRRYRAALHGYLAVLEPLRTAGLVLDVDPFARRPELAAQRLQALPPDTSPQRAALAEAVGRFVEADRDPMLERDGPNWYRGAALCNACAEADVLRPILQQLGVRRVVIGHTVARNRTVATRFDGAVIKLDAGMNRAVYGGRPAALVIERGEARVLYGDGPSPPAAIGAEGRYVTHEAIEDGRIVELLGSGNVTVGPAPVAPGVLGVTVEGGGQTIPAVFIATTAEAVRRELAAYRMDRLLGLGLVPATIEREVQGQRGVLQARPDRWATQADVQQQSLRMTGWCSLPPQFELMYAFDALIGNEGRTAERIGYDAEEWMLLLTGHDRAFGTSRGFPAHLAARPPSPGPELRRRLAALDPAQVDAALEGLVGQRERRALFARRDLMLAPAAGPAAVPAPR